MAINLSRNTKLFVSTVQDTDVAGHDTTTTFEVPILDGYSFSQEADTQTITLNEAGDAPVRGQRIFNTALNPGDVSFTTYVRPYYTGTNHDCVEKILWEGLVGAGKDATVTTATVGTNAKPGTTFFQADFENSNEHELLPLYLFFQVDNAVYRLNGFSVNSAEIDFSIDAIASITWNGQCTSIEELGTTDGALRSEFDTWAADTDYVEAAGIASGGTEALFIKNKLSSISLVSTSASTEEIWEVDYNGALDPNAAHTLGATTDYFFSMTLDGTAGTEVHVDTTTFSGTTVADAVQAMNDSVDGATIYIQDGNLRIVSQTAGSTSEVSTVVDNVTNPLLATLDTTNFVSVGAVIAGTGTGTPKTYNVPITGGSLTVENNITYLVPEELGKVNQPIGSFTGTRAVSGSLTAYLNTGGTNTGGLLADLVSDTATITHDFEMTISMGGGANTPRVDFTMPNSHLVIPSINVEDVVSTEISFTGLGTQITDSDELYIRYYAQ